MNDFIALGQGTFLIALDDLGAGESYFPLTARFYTGAGLGAAPQWTGADAWPVAFESLADPSDVTSAKLTVKDSYTTGDTWVSRGWGEIPLTLHAGSARLELPIREAVITMKLDSSRKFATNGTLSGVIPTEAFVQSFKRFVAEVEPTFCSSGAGATFDSLWAQVASMSDILVDGTQDPTKTCDGISIGIGFDAQVVKLGPIVPLGPPPEPCQM